MISFNSFYVLTIVRAAILGSSVALMLPGAWGHSVTVVEFAHLPSGLAAWERGSLGIYRVCGPATKLVYALPAYLAGVRVDYPDAVDTDLRSRREWELGQIFQDQYTANYHTIYRWSRLVPILMTLVGGCLVSEWSTRLFGVRPGLAALGIWCWSPPILAHGSLLTSDIAAAVTALLAARTFWSVLLHPRPVGALVAGVMLGLAAATKFTLALLYPCWGLLLVARMIQALSSRQLGGQHRGVSPGRFVAVGGAILVISLLVLDALYLFEGVGFRLEDWALGQSNLARIVDDLRQSPATRWLLRVPLPIPIEFLRGLDFQLADTERVQSAYLLGQIRIGGWWFWYPAAMCLKAPLPVLGLVALSLLGRGTVGQRSTSSFWASLCLLVPAAELAIAIAVSTGTGTNAAFRYLLPSLALVGVWLGRAFRDGSPRTSRVAVGLLAWLLGNAVVGLPDHLAWRNEIAQIWERASGRPALIGDSRDWGQDHARLAAWIAYYGRDGGVLVWVYGLGSGDPYGLRPPAAMPPSTPRDQARYIAVSVDVIYGYDINACLTIGDDRLPSSSANLDRILTQKPLAQIGESILIYPAR